MWPHGRLLHPLLTSPKYFMKNCEDPPITVQGRNNSCMSTAEVPGAEDQAENRLTLWDVAVTLYFPEPLCNLNFSKPTCDKSGNFFRSLRECCHWHQCVNGANDAVSIVTMCCEGMSSMSSSGGCEPSPVSKHTDSQFHYLVARRDLHLLKPAPQNSVFWFDILENIFTVYRMWVHSD